MTLRPFFFHALIALLLLTACAPGAVPVSGAAVPESDAASVEFTLVTGESEGRMVFIGRGGDIDGVVNPDLKTSPGDRVRLVLVIGDGMLHDVALPDLDVQSEAISKPMTRLK